MVQALSRFNIYPEYVLGLLHRCITVVVAVDPYTLVMHAIFALAGIQLAVMFLVGAYTTHTYVVVAGCLFKPLPPSSHCARDHRWVPLPGMLSRVPDTWEAS